MSGVYNGFPLCDGQAVDRAVLLSDILEMNLQSSSFLRRPAFLGLWSLPSPSEVGTVVFPDVCPSASLITSPWLTFLPPLPCKESYIEPTTKYSWAIPLRGDSDCVFDWISSCSMRWSDARAQRLDLA